MIDWVISDRGSSIDATSLLRSSWYITVSLPVMHQDWSTPPYVIPTILRSMPKYCRKLETILQNRSPEIWRRVVMFSLCVAIVIANLQMGPPVNLTLIANSTSISKSSGRTVLGIVELAPRGKLLENGENLNNRSGTRTTAAELVRRSL